MLSEQQQRIMGYFIEEAKDHLNTIEQGLLNLQSTIEDAEMVSEVFRAAHSVKGGAAMLGLTSIQQVSHRLEDFFKVLKECPLKVDRTSEDLFLKIFDALKELLDQLQGPFGLTDDKAAEVMAMVEPSFTALGAHLSQLVTQSGGTLPDEVELPAIPAVALRPFQTRTTPQLEEVSALQLIFKSDVPERLRQLLQLFKQADSANSRQQLQQVCQRLMQAGEQFDLPEWSELMNLAQQAIANSDNTYRALAPILIKEIKQAQELVLAGQSADIAPGAHLVALVPFQSVSPAAMDLSVDEPLDMDEWLSEPVTQPLLSDADLGLERLEPRSPSDAVPSMDDLGFGEEFDRSVEMSTSIDRHGPEVGMAELNSLADLFEGEVPELGMTWQEEEVVVPPADEFGLADSDEASDFADLLFDQGLDDLALDSSDEDDDLSGLLNQSELRSRPPAELDLTALLADDPAIEELTDVDLSLDFLSPSEATPELDDFSIASEFDAAIELDPNEELRQPKVDQPDENLTELFGDLNSFTPDPFEASFDESSLDAAFANAAEPWLNPFEAELLAPEDSDNHDDPFADLELADLDSTPLDVAPLPFPSLADVDTDFSADLTEQDLFLTNLNDLALADTETIADVGVTNLGSSDQPEPIPDPWLAFDTGVGDATVTNEPDATQADGATQADVVPVDAFSEASGAIELPALSLEDPELTDLEGLDVALDFDLTEESDRVEALSNSVLDDLMLDDSMLDDSNLFESMGFDLEELTADDAANVSLPAESPAQELPVVAEDEELPDLFETLDLDDPFSLELENELELVSSSSLDAALDETGLTEEFLLFGVSIEQITERPVDEPIASLDPLDALLEPPASLESTTEDLSDLFDIDLADDAEDGNSSSLDAGLFEAMDASLEPLGVEPSSAELLDRDMDDSLEALDDPFAEMNLTLDSEDVIVLELASDSLEADQGVEPWDDLFEEIVGEDAMGLEFPLESAEVDQGLEGLGDPFTAGIDVELDQPNSMAPSLDEAPELADFQLFAEDDRSDDFSLDAELNDIESDAIESDLIDDGLIDFDLLGLDDLELPSAEVSPTEPLVMLDGDDRLLDATGFDLEQDANLDKLEVAAFDFDSLLGEDAAPEGVETANTNDFLDLDSFQEPLSPVEPAVSDEAIEPGFFNLEALLADELVEDELDEFSPTTEDEFADLEALLAEQSLSPTASTGLPIPPLTDVTNFDDLEKLLEDADKTLGGSPTSRGTRNPALPNRSRASRIMTDQTMRVSVKNLDNLNNLVGELVVNRNSLEQAQERLRQFLDNLLYQVQQLSDVGQRMRDLYERSLLESSLLSNRRSYQSFAATEAASSTHATGASFDALEMDRFTGFHTLSQEMIELIVRVRESSSDIDFVVDESDQVTRNFRQITTQLQEGLTRSRMVPFAQTADRLPRAVRDISQRCGKQAELAIEGRETLIDKMILEQLYDPMTHLVNNAITHGIEVPEERLAAGKPAIGRITVRTFHQGNQTVISVTDDGAGINPDLVKRKAIEKGLITPAQAQDMTRLDVYDLLFHHGFSTRDRADDFAGRGVGMDVVRTSLNEIRGVVNIDSTVGRGTTFTIRLPLTLSISKALCCISNRARVAFPMDGVEDMLDVPKERVLKDEHNRSCIQWRDILLPFQPLSDLLGYNRSLGRGSVYGGNQEDDMVSVVVLRSAGNFLALQVDQVLGEQEIVIKQLEGPVPKPVGVAGATVLGDGRIMPIVDVLELIDLSMGRIRRDVGSSLWEKTDHVPIEPVDVKTEPTVLIVDDSITVRELLSMTFNKIGYRVEQARDGQEAWEKLRSGLPCDIVFCDIEMPRMDGLELLSRIQKDSSLNHLPVAMLTSRGADRHRQMAVQLGAKGYFTKPYLEEALLDAAQRMLNGEVLVTNGSNS